MLWNRIYCALVFIIGLGVFQGKAQDRILIHSHNDYRQTVPFYQAYAQKTFSIEADVFLEGGELLVGHEPEELSPLLNFQELYINPLVKLYERNGGTAWKGSKEPLQLVVELKSDTKPTLDKVIEVLDKHEHVFNPQANPNAVRVVITGKVPDPADFESYPDFIAFDGQVDIDYTDAQLKRIAMISPPFFEYADWNGKGTLTGADKKRVREVIDKVHRLGKPIRFWGTPEGVTAWNTFHRMGVDIINTDEVEEVTLFFKNFVDKNYRIREGKVNSKGVTTTEKLDKVTSRFKGFDHQEIQLSTGIEVYEPGFTNDGGDGKVKNIILLIGDGMGLAQINAAEAANENGLTLLNLKNIGLSITTPRGAFTVESASGGSALATGRKTDNRHISMTEDGRVVPAITDFTAEKGLTNGVITLGNLADATPAVFYGHATDRDFSDEITSYLPEGKLEFLVGSGMSELTDREDGKDLIRELEDAHYKVSNDYQDLAAKEEKLIVADARFDLAATQGTLDLLAQTTKMGIERLDKTNEKGFFLMVEGAKIDYAGHSNSLPGVVVEMLSFDLAIAEALRFADQDGETLVIVTADHETGGLTLVDGDREKGLITGVFVTEDHTPIMVPVFAYGLGSQHFRGVYEQKEIFHKMMKLLNLN